MSTHPANPRPKRGAEQWTRVHHQDSDSLSPKKARFDLRNPSALAPDAQEEEEDAFLEADETTKRGNQTKRNAVNIDGFESDSSNEGFDARAAAKAKAKKDEEKAAAASKDDDEEDMFADLEDEEAPANDNDDENQEGKRKKTVKFVDLDQVKDLGENSHSKSGGHVKADLRGPTEDDRESSSESEVDDEIRAGLEDGMDAELGAGAKKKHAPKLDAFNLREENQEGKFDESFNYLRKVTDPDAILDNWMEGTSKKDMRRAREAQDKREHERQQKRRTDDATLTSDVLDTLISYLQRGETALEALARLAPKKAKKKPKWQNTRAKDQHGKMDVESVAETDIEEQKRREAIDAITGSSDLLMERGVIDINDPREILLRHYRKETGEDWVSSKGEADADPPLDNDTNAKMWEFRWSNAPDGKIQGPEPHDKMKAWSDAGYFADGVEFRPAGSQGPWRASVVF